MSEQNLLANFLIKLSDPRTLAMFRQDPESVFKDAEMSDAEKSAVMNGLANLSRSRAALGKESGTSATSSSPSPVGSTSNLVPMTGVIPRNNASYEDFAMPIAEIPEIHELPEIPEIHELPEIPEIHELPEIPELPEIHELPEIPELPETPKGAGSI